MKKALIVINAKYLPVYKAHLDRAGYSYTEEDCDGIIELTVKYKNFKNLYVVTQTARIQCRFKRLTYPPFLVDT